MRPTLRQWPRGCDLRGLRASMIPPQQRPTHAGTKRQLQPGSEFKGSSHRVASPGPKRIFSASGFITSSQGVHRSPPPKRDARCITPSACLSSCALALHHHRQASLSRTITTRPCTPPPRAPAPDEAPRAHSPKGRAPSPPAQAQPSAPQRAPQCSATHQLTSCGVARRMMQRTMGEIFSGVFWLLTLTSAVIAFAIPTGTVHLVSASWLLCVGAVFSALNAGTMLPKHGRRPSMIPLFGGLLLALSAWAMPWPNRSLWRLATVLCDPWYLGWVSWPLYPLFRRLRNKLPANRS